MPSARRRRSIRSARKIGGIFVGVEPQQGHEEKGERGPSPLSGPGPAYEEENMQRLPFLGCLVFIAVAGCTGAIPYRVGGYVPDTLCKTLYDDYDSTTSDPEVANMNWDDQCWS